MSNAPDPKKQELSFFEQIGSELPALTKEEQAAVAELRSEGMGQEMKGLPISYPRIEMIHGKNAAFNFVATQDIVKGFSAVLIYVDSSRVWWPQRFGAAGSEGGFPKCFSRDLVKPDPEGEMKQAETCGSCAQNQWKSAVNTDGSQGRGKACKEVRRLFFIPEGHMTPHWMAVPPSSLKSLSSYFVSCRDKGFKKPQEVIMRVSAKTIENADDVEYSELALEMGKAVPETWLAQVASYKKSIEDMINRVNPLSKDEFEGGATKSA
jgi:hypothetical protein